MNADGAIEVDPPDDEWAVATAPDGDVEVPTSVTHVVGDHAVRCVWRNQLGGLTFEIPGVDRFLKWAPPGSPLQLLDEAERLRWVHRFTVVPEVLDAGTADDGSTWLLTKRVPGTSAVDARWKASPKLAVRAIGEGLRAFHDASPVSECPFDWSANSRVARAQRNADLGELDPTSWHTSHRHLGVDDALAILAERPSEERVVVCHGDACAPNTLLDDDGRCSGHVDMGAMGVADFWSDLAVASWSAEWNYGPGWEAELVAAYGTSPDAERLRYYRLLWDVVD